MEESTAETLKEALLSDGGLSNEGARGLVAPRTSTGSTDCEKDAPLAEDPLKKDEDNKGEPHPDVNPSDSLELTLHPQETSNERTSPEQGRPGYVTASDCLFLCFLGLILIQSRAMDVWLAMYYLLMWMGLLGLPLSTHPGLEFRDLRGIALATLVFCIYCSQDDYYEGLPPFFVGHFCLLCFAVWARAKIENPGRQCCFVVACLMFGGLVSSVDGEDFVPFLMVLFVGILPLVGCLSLCQDSECMGYTCGRILPCFRALKRMELDAQEVEEDNDEEANQAQVDRQIAQLGRPMQTTNSYMERGQWRFAVAAGILSLWVCVSWLSFHSDETSTNAIKLTVGHYYTSIVNDP